MLAGLNREAPNAKLMQPSESSSRAPPSLVVEPRKQLWSTNPMPIVLPVQKLAAGDPKRQTYDT